MRRDFGRLTGLLKKAGLCFAWVPALVIASAPRAEAILRYYIHDSGGIGRIDALGSLNLPTALGEITGIAAYCPSNSSFFPPTGGAGLQTKSSQSALNICTGPAASFAIDYKGYAIERTYQDASFVSTNRFASAALTSGLATGLIGESLAFYIQSSYNVGSIASSALFSGTLDSVGISGSGLKARYSILDGTTVTDTIEVLLEAPPPPVPGPLPVLGASLAFAWSRQLRQRAAMR
jgi:hypothetical protein